MTAKVELATVTQARADSDIDETGNVTKKLAPHLQNWETEYLSAFPRTIQDKASKDPAYMGELLAARHILVDMMRHEAVRRAIVPTQRPIYQRGELLGYEEVRDNKHLEWMLERLDPDEFNLARKLEVTGEGGAPIRFAFNMGDTPDEFEASDAEFEESDEPEAA